jgi:phosphotransferase system HPr-like phosphotransfer protein
MSAVAVVKEDQKQEVKVVVKCKDTHTLFARPRYMTLEEANRFKAAWDFHHIDGDYYVDIERKKVVLQ